MEEKCDIEEKSSDIEEEVKKSSEDSEDSEDSDIEEEEKSKDWADQVEEEESRPREEIWEEILEYCS